MRQPRRFLLVLWQSGGGTQPMLGLARLLVDRGHTVDVLAPEPLRERVARTGARWRPSPPEVEFDGARGRALEDQPEFTAAVTCGRALAVSTLEIASSSASDVVVVDHFLFSSLDAAQASGRATVAFVHTAHRFDVPAESAWDAAARARLDDTRIALGRGARRPSRESLRLEILRSCDLALVSMTREFDPWPRPPATVLHVGPLFEEPDALVWDDPWLQQETGLIVAVSLSTQYMHQEDTLRRILAGLSTLAVRVVVTTGYELDPGEVVLPPGAIARAYVPHRALLPHAALAVTHGGMGTIMAAFACATPLVCVPLGRDQPGNAQRVVELGAGIALPEDADAASIAGAVTAALDSEELRRGAARMRASVASYGGGVEAVAALERLAAGGRPAKE